MATETITYAPTVGIANSLPIHPLSPLTSAEISKAASLIRGLYPSQTEFQFKAVTLEEPEKARLVPFLEAENAGQRSSPVDRRAFVCYYLRNTVSFSRCVPLTSGNTIKLTGL